MQKFKIILVILCISLSCKKSPELDNKYLPVFIGDVVPFVSYKEVSFSAVFENNDPGNKNECGFEWGERLKDSTLTVIVGNISGGIFNKVTPATLNEKTEYVVRAWVKIGSKKYYSQPTYFQGLVVLKPEIVSLVKSYAIWGDTIKVKVRNLSTNVLSRDIKATINDINVETIHADSGEIEIRMPYIESAGNFKIALKANGQSFSNTAEIENALPVITSISPKKMHWEDTIILKGKFRPEYSKRLIPYMDQHTSYTVLRYTSNEIILKPSEWMFSCYAKFDIYINIIEPTGNTGYFHGYNSGFSVDRAGHWNSLAKAAPTLNSKGVFINGEGYVLEMNSPEANTHFWKYNPLTDQWTALKDYPGIIPSDGAMVICNGNIYAGLERTTYGNSNLYRYDIQNNNWIKCARLGLSDRWVNTVTIQDKLYVFFQQDGESFYKAIYDPMSDSWTKTNYAAPNFNIDNQWFIYNEEHYFYDGGKSIYNYNISSSTFTRINFDWLSFCANCDGPLFAMNGRFFRRHSCHIYECNMKDQKEINSLNFSRWTPDYYGSPDFTSTSLFEYNGKAYFLIQPNKVITFSTENE